MIKYPEIVATIAKTESGNFVFYFDIPRMLQAALSAIGEGVKVRVDIKKWYKKRTIPQNNMIWGPDYALILAHIQATTGDVFSAEELHDWHKRKFLGFKESNNFPGLYRLGSTKDLDTVGFAKFREDYCRFWAINGLYIPDPDFMNPAKITARPSRLR